MVVGYVKSGSPAPKRRRTTATAAREEDVDDIPISLLYIPRPKPLRRAAPSTSNSAAALLEKQIVARKVDKEQSRNESPKNHRFGAKVQSTEAVVECIPIANGKGVFKGTTRPVFMTLTDPDLLDCPICFEPLSSPVYQCKNGHIACASCCTKVLKNKCANCCLPIPNSRNRAIENVLESVRVRCQYRAYGCPEIFSYSMKVAHENRCYFVPCSCPCCDFVGLSKRVYNHFALKHADSSKQFFFDVPITISMDSTEKHVILREGREGVLFVLNRCVETLGSFFSVVCVAPPSSKKRWYELVAIIGEDSIRLESSVEMRSKWTVHTPARTSLVVPSNMISKSEVLSLDLIIWREPARPKLFYSSG